MLSLLPMQVKTLLYRNLLLTKRKKSETAEMIGFPIYFVVLLVILKHAAYQPRSFPEMPNLQILNLTSFIANKSTSFKNIYIAPMEVQGIDQFKQKLQNLTNSSVTIFKDQASMDNAYRKNSIINPIGILFNGYLYNYSLRFPYNESSGSQNIDYSQSNCRSENFSANPGECPANMYITSGFLALQTVVDLILIQKYDDNYQFPNITLQRMARSGGQSGADAFTIVSAIYLVFAMSPFMIVLLVNVVAEKQKKIKEAMKVMGLSSFALWFSWSLTYGIILLVMTLIMSAIIKYGNLFSYSSFMLIFLIFFLYGLSLQMLGFMLTPFFINSRTAGTAGGFINLVFGLLYFTVSFVSTIPIGAIWGLNLLAPTGFAVAMGEIAKMEVSEIGADFSNIWTGKYPVGITLVMLTVDIFLYFLLTIYFDQIIPGEYGQRQPFYFPLMPSYWFPSCQEVHAPSSSKLDYAEEDFEPVPSDLNDKTAIKFSHITKVYSNNWSCEPASSTTAINDFSLDIYEGQITALLGHNGAGKTTLFNILTGFIDTTSGQASVYNFNIKNPSDLQKIHQMTGFCPQHNILFDVLSVREHLKVFAGIKGIPYTIASQETERIINLIGLKDQADTFAKKLSGGQKRKLSLGIAIIGDPKILILDEPTAGMDPYSRHTMWNILRDRKEGRVTLLTTHFMDEADILADRKAILSRGKLRCVGSSLFLKNRFGIGYHLGVVTKNAGNHSALINFVNEKISGAQLQRASGFEVAFTLPITEVGNFPELFGSFESDSDELGVQSFGVSMTTLEEVFLRIGEEDEGEKESNEVHSSNTEIREKMLKVSARYNIEEDNLQLHDSSTIDVKSKTKFNPAIAQVSEPVKTLVFFTMVKMILKLNARSPTFLIFGLVLPLALAIGGAALLTTNFSAEDTQNPPIINITAGSIPEYQKFLYKNSTGMLLEDFISNRPVEVEANNLSNLFPSPYPHHYLASNIFQFNTNQMSYNALYNTSGIQTIPMILNVMSQSMLRFINSSALAIITQSKRWPALSEVRVFDGGIFGGVLMSAYAVIMTTAIPAILPVYEREMKIRSQLRVSGITFSLYWGTRMLVDFCWYLIVAIGFFIGIVAFNVEELTTSGAIVALILQVIGSGISCIFASYCGSFLFNKTETVSSVWFNILQLFMFLPYLIVSLLDQLSSSVAATALNVVFVVFIPYYTFFSGLYYIARIYTKRLLSGDTSLIPASAYFNWSEPMIPFSILIAYLHILVFAFLVVVLDVRKNGGKISEALGVMRSNRTSDESYLVNDNQDFDEDDDVKEERRKVNSAVSARDFGSLVLVQNLRKEFSKRTETKWYQRQKKKEEKIKVAVKNLSFSVQPGQVLGLLGPNGAGKTTALSVLTADLAPTHGQVFVTGHNIQSNISDAFQNMGFCSQDNPLWELLTLKEHLEIYAVARGILKKSIPKMIDNYVDALSIREHLNKRAKTLSGGTKRKLCFAIAMLGNPNVVLLDEPSTGMDPKTKRFMWNTISTAFEGSSRGAILTTHYMEEADALCTRVAIMVLGQLRCIGSTQHLKNKFGQGYSLEIKIGERHSKEVTTRLNELVGTIFDNVSSPEIFSHRYVYKIPQGAVSSLAKVFETLEKSKKRFGIEEYSFSQSTLEQVFLQFAKEQDEREAEKSS